VTDGTPLGSLLIDEGLLTEAQLDAAVLEQSRTGKPLGRLLIEQGTISEAELVHTLARQVGLEFVDLNDRTIDGSVAALVSESLARRYQAIPVGWEDGKLVVAMADPSNVFAVDDIRALAGAEVHTVVATASQIIETIERFFRVDGEVDELEPDLAGQGADELGLGDRPGLDEEAAEGLAAPGLLRERRVELRVGQQSFVDQQRTQRCAVGHRRPPLLPIGKSSTPRVVG